MKSERKKNGQARRHPLSHGITLSEAQRNRKDLPLCHESPEIEGHHSCGLATALSRHLGYRWYFDKEYQKETRQLWDLWKAGRYRFVSSIVVEEEIEPAPEQVELIYAP